MATPGGKNYRGPVHEAVRSALDAIGAGDILGTGGKSAPRGSKPPGVKTQTLADRKLIAKGNMRNATASSRNKGAYDTYDPLSSVASNTAIKRKTTKKRKPAARKGK